MLLKGVIELMKQIDGLEDSVLTLNEGEETNSISRVEGKTL
ncbi:hypothetical protein [Paenibacillus sp. GSMTC-2017]|nr:hypothetical protein [Paenibacillus sp. GSMTC-2017]